MRLSYSCDIKAFTTTLYFSGLIAAKPLEATCYAQYPQKVGVIGYGYSAKTFHLPFIDTLESLTLSAISSSQQQVVQADWPQIAYFDSAQRLITESNVDFEIITAPNDVHFLWRYSL